MPSTKSNEQTQRSAGRVQGALLLVGSCMPVLGAVLIAPVLPRIRDEFLGTPGVDALVPLALVIPSLFIALLSPVAGVLADRVGRTRLLTGGLVLFALAGTAPLWLASLPAIVASRAVLGVAEAVIITCCTTLIGDYFPGARRDRYLGLQVAVTSLAATAFFVIGGALGETGWRTPFWLYAVGLVLAPLVALLLPPVRPGTAAAAEARAARPPVPWGRLALPLALTLIGALLFYVVPTQMSFVLDELGVRSTQTIGQVTGAAALATAIGGFLAGRFAASRMRVLLPLEFAVAAAGLLLLGAAGTSVAVATTGAIVASIGVGLLLPTLLIWTMGLLEIGIRGAGTGAWNTTFFLGQFLCPLLLLAIAGGGSLLPAVTVFGWAAVVMVVVAVVVGRRQVTPVGPGPAVERVEPAEGESAVPVVPVVGVGSAAGVATEAVAGAVESGADGSGGAGSGDVVSAGAGDDGERAGPAVSGGATVASGESAGAGRVGAAAGSGGVATTGGNSASATAGESGASAASGGTAGSGGSGEDVPAGAAGEPGSSGADASTNGSGPSGGTGALGGPAATNGSGDADGTGSAGSAAAGSSSGSGASSAPAASGATVPSNGTVTASDESALSLPPDGSDEPREAPVGPAAGVVAGTDAASGGAVESPLPTAGPESGERIQPIASGAAVPSGSGTGPEGVDRPDAGVASGAAAATGPDGPGESSDDAGARGAAPAVTGTGPDPEPAPDDAEPTERAAGGAPAAPGESGEGPVAGGSSARS